MESLSDVRDPIGTLAELAEIGADPTRVPSCSKRTGQQAGGNKGCPWHRACRFTPWRDQMQGLQGPLNIGVEVILSNSDGGAHNQKEMECYTYYSANYRVRAKASEETGEIVRIVAYEGDGKEIAEWCTRSTPPDSVNKNGRAVPYLHKHEISPFKRPKERFPVEVGRQSAREEMMDDLERQALKNVLSRTSPRAAEILGAGELAATMETVDVDFKGPVGPGKKVKG